MLKVIVLSDFGSFAVLNSFAHEAWARKYSSTLETRLKYSPSDAFESFPRPNDVTPLEVVGRRLHERRGEFMVALGIGLTKLYNRIHDPSVTDDAIRILRELTREVDVAVLEAYGWGDIQPDHDFHHVPYLPENDRLRFTVSESARLEVLQRLADLNRTCYEAENGRELHGREDAGLVNLQAERHRRTRSGRPSLQESSNRYSQSDLAFEEPSRKVAERGPSYIAANGAAHRIRSWLVNHRGWHAKEEILSGSRVAPGEWPTAIKELLESGAVAKQGERRGTKYSARQQ